MQLTITMILFTMILALYSVEAADAKKKKPCNLPMPPLPEENGASTALLPHLGAIVSAIAAYGASTRF